MFKPFDVDNVFPVHGTEAIGRRLSEMNPGDNPAIYCGMLLAYLVAVERDVDEAVLELDAENTALRRDKEKNVKKAEAFDLILKIWSEAKENKEIIFDSYTVENVINQYMEGSG